LFLLTYLNFLLKLLKFFQNSCTLFRATKANAFSFLFF
jgi:hypothetical protein